MQGCLRALGIHDINQVSFSVAMALLLDKRRTSFGTALRHSDSSVGKRSGGSFNAANASHA